MSAPLAEFKGGGNALEVEAFSPRTFEKYSFDAIQRLDTAIIQLDRKIKQLDAKFDGRFRVLEAHKKWVEKWTAKLKSAFDACPAMIAGVIRTGLSGQSSKEWSQRRALYHWPGGREKAQ